MHTRAARAARGLVAAGFATFVAAVSHTAAGGLAPSAFGVLASFVLSAAACTLLAGRTLSLWRLAASVAISQALFHGLFSTLGTPVPVAHEHHAIGMAAAAPVAYTDMVLAHVAAGLLTLAALRYGERAFWGMAATARLLFARLRPVAIPVPASLPRVAPESRVHVPASILLLSPRRHRGPPLGFAAA